MNGVRWLLAMDRMEETPPESQLGTSRDRGSRLLPAGAEVLRRRRARARVARVALAIVAFAFLNPMARAEVPEKMTIQLRWYHQFQFAGYYAAVEKGFFADEGLEVTLRERRWDSLPVQDVLSGEAEYGIGDATLLLDRMRGEPVVLIAQIFQHAPGVLMALRDSHITSPADLIGKKVMTVSDDAGVQAMLLNELGDLSRIEIVEHPGNLDLFTAGEVDALAGYVSNEPFLLKQEGHAVYIMDPRDYGIDQYGDNLFTTEHEISNRPDRVAKVARAVIRGWQYAFAHVEEMIDLIITKYAPHKMREHLEFEAKMTEMLVLPDLVAIGHVSPGRYERIAATFSRLGFVSAAGVPEGFIYTPPAAIRSELGLSPREEAWLVEQASVPLVVASGMTPYAFVDDNGTFAGVLADICARLETLLGIRFVYEAASRGEMRQAARKGEELLMAGLDPWDVGEGAPYASTREVLVMPYALFALEDARAADVISQKGAGRVVAIRREWDPGHPALVAIGPCTFVRAATVLDCINMVLQGEADALFDLAPVVTNLLGSHSIRSIRMVEVFTQGYPMTFLVREDTPELRGALDKALAVITAGERVALLENWNVYLEDPGYRLVAVYLTREERQWLLDHPVVRVGSDAAWAPIEFKDEQAEHQGVAVDYVRAVEDLLGTRFEIVKGASRSELSRYLLAGEVDMLSSVTATDKLRDQAILTTPYMTLPVNVFAGNDVTYVASLDELAGKRVAVVSGHAAEQWLATDHPHVEVVALATTADALAKLRQREVFAFVADLVTTGYYLGLLKAVDVKVAGDTDYEYRQTMAVRGDWPIFASILQKALDAIPAARRNEIQRAWLSVSYEYGFDYRRFWQVLALAALAVGAVAGFFLYWNRRLSMEVRRRRAAEHQLLQAKDDAESASRAKSRFLANVSHEIRTPMNAILGYAHLLKREEGLTPEQRDYLHSISRSGAHLLGLLDDVLDMSKIEAGRVTLNAGPLSLQAVVADIGRMFRVRTEAKRITLEICVAEDLPDIVIADEGKLRQILINLLSNAVQYTDRGTIALRVVAGKDATSAGLLASVAGEAGGLPPAQLCAVCFEVEDTGRGIRPSDLERIFAPFERSWDEAADAGGVGLGLAISRQYAVMMGGMITVESALGRGSCFRLVVPMMTDSAGEPRECSAPLRETRDDPEPSGAHLPARQGGERMKLAPQMCLEGPVQVARAGLSSLPVDLISRLRVAVRIGDMHELEELSAEIAAHDKVVGRALADLVATYEHNSLRDVLERGAE